MLQRMLLFLLLLTILVHAAEVRVGSKKFTESVILGEIATQMASSAGYRAIHHKELGGTRILWNALLKGEIDIYPDYSGTILKEILAGKSFNKFEKARIYLDSLGIGIIGPLGFNNTYALGMLKKEASVRHIDTISDLTNYPDLIFGFSNEFMDRSDGWPGLRDAYNLPQKNVRGLDHDLAYRGLVSGSIQLMELYSTDAEIKYYNLFVLQDNRHYFPEYKALYLYRKEIRNIFPAFTNLLQEMNNAVPESLMIAMNARAKLDKVPASVVAADFLKQKFKIDSHTENSTWLNRLWENTLQHLFLVVTSLLAAILIAIPFGILATRNKKMGQIVLSVVGIIQTIPSLAILVFMIPVLGIGAEPAIAALFLYSLLPIVRNTHSGISDIAVHIIDSAHAIGLTDTQCLRFVELPLAARSILSGIKTAAVINVGTATLGALIGAGGYGQPILTGIRLDDVGLILEGAVPAALLALVVQGLFDLLERWVVPTGIR